MRIRSAVIQLCFSLLLMFFGIQSVVFAAQNGGDDVTSSIWAKAVLEVPGSPVTLVWKMVGADITPSGDQVISGYFYADPDDFAYGSVYNPELFVKIYIATNGWCNIAFNHVTVDDVSVYSMSGGQSQSSNATLNSRLVEHQYEGVSIDSSLQTTGEPPGTSSSQGYTLISGLWAKAVLQPSTGAINLIWKEVGTDITPSGDTVVSGYFYASPEDFAYGSLFNPEVFVKVYIASNGWANMAFNHVTVDNVTIHSANNHSDQADQTGAISLNERLAEQTYTNVEINSIVAGVTNENGEVLLTINNKPTQFIVLSGDDPFEGAVSNAKVKVNYESGYCEILVESGQHYGYLKIIDFYELNPSERLVLPATDSTGLKISYQQLSFDPPQISGQAVASIPFSQLDTFLESYDKSINTIAIYSKTDQLDLSSSILDIYGSEFNNLVNIYASSTSSIESLSNNKIGSLGLTDAVKFYVYIFSTFSDMVINKVQSLKSILADIKPNEKPTVQLNSPIRSTESDTNIEFCWKSTDKEFDYPIYYKQQLVISKSNNLFDAIYDENLTEKTMMVSLNSGAETCQTLDLPNLVNGQRYYWGVRVFDPAYNDWTGSSNYFTYTGDTDASRMLGTFKLTAYGDQPSYCNAFSDIKVVITNNKDSLMGNCDHIYIPSGSNSERYSYIDCDNDFVYRTVTLNGNTIHIDEVGECSGLSSACWTYYFTIEFDPDFSGGTITGTRYDEDSSICQGTINGSFSKFDPTTKSGLVAYYPFEGSADDTSGNKNHGVENGGLSYSNGVNGQAAYFDGVDDYVAITNKEVLSSRSFTFTAWVNSYSDQYILSQWTAGSTVDNLIFRTRANEYVGLSLRKGSPPFFQSEGLTIPSNEWFFVAISYDDVTGNGVFFINDQSESFNSGITDRTVSTIPEICIGKQRYNYEKFGYGLIDELRIYDRVLSNKVIQDIYLLDSSD